MPPDTQNHYQRYPPCPYGPKKGSEALKKWEHPRQERCLFGIQNEYGTGDLYIFDSTISDLSGFNNLLSTRWLNIIRTSIDDLSGFEKLEQIDIDLYIYDSNIEKFNGFNGLSSIGNDLNISINSGFKEFKGLSTLNSIGNDLIINYNSNISDISSLNEINDVKGIIQIVGNPNLNTCNINIVCDHLDQRRVIVIQGNKKGCNSKSEVKAACEGNLSIEDSKKLIIEIFPNPTKDFIHINYGLKIPTKIELFDTNGRIILESESLNSIDMRSLNAGTYILKFTFADGINVKKISKY